MASSAPACSTAAQPRCSPWPATLSMYYSASGGAFRRVGDICRASTSKTSGENDCASMMAAFASVGALTQKPLARRSVTAMRRRSVSETAIRMRGARFVSRSVLSSSAVWGHSRVIGSERPVVICSLSVVSVRSFWNSRRNEERTASM